MREALQFEMVRAEWVIYCSVLSLKWIPRFKVCVDFYRELEFYFERNETRGVNSLNSH